MRKRLPKTSIFHIIFFILAPFPVNYDKTNWNLLLKFLQSKHRTQIPELTRAKLLHDAWNLAYAGELSFATALNMTLFLKDERNHLVWDPVFTMIDHIGRHICQCIHVKFQVSFGLCFSLYLLCFLSFLVLEKYRNCLINQSTLIHCNVNLLIKWIELWVG